MLCYIFGYLLNEIEVKSLVDLIRKMSYFIENSIHEEHEYFEKPYQFLHI